MERLLYSYVFSTILSVFVLLGETNLCLAAGSVLLTDSLATWQAAAPGYVNSTTGYGTASTTLGAGSVSYDSGTVLSIGSGWSTWCCGYTGEVVWEAGASTATLTFGNLQAFGLQIEPNQFAIESITVTLSNGQSLTDNVNGFAGAQFFGFVGTGITSMTIKINASDDFAFGNFYAHPVADKVTITSADLVRNTVNVVLSSSPGVSGALTVTANGVVNKYNANVPAGGLGPGSYQLSFDRPNMPADTYSSITATWNISPTPALTTFSLTDEWLVFGLIRHSQYNTPYESKCKGGTDFAWIFDSHCQFMQVRLNNKFMDQVYLNGTGQSISYGILKYNNPITGACSGLYPKGANAHNTFRPVPSVTGACGTTLVGGISVATNPSPNAQSVYKCGDAILLATSTNTNQAVKSADDYCPACSGQFAGTQGHIDDYSSSQACTSADVGDYGNFWTANTHGETK